MIVLHSHIPCCKDANPYGGAVPGIDARSIWNNAGIEWLCPEALSAPPAVRQNRFGSWHCNPIMIYVGY